MSHFFRALAVAAAFAAAALVADRASAVPLSDVAGIRAAANAVGGAETVHCVPGFWHHRFNPHDGCFRVYRAPPRFYVAPRPRYRVYRPYRWRRY